MNEKSKKLLKVGALAIIGYYFFGEMGLVVAAVVLLIDK